MEPLETSQNIRDAPILEPLETSKLDNPVIDGPLETSPNKKKKVIKKPLEKSKRKVVKVGRKPLKKSSAIKRTKIKLGTVHIFVDSENVTDEVGLPQHPVENGLSITDHVQKKAKGVTLQVTLFKDSKHTIHEKLEKLNKYRREGTRLTYTGRRVARDMAIKSVETKSTYELSNGLEATIVLQEIRIIGKKKKKKGSKKTNSKTTGGRKQTSNAKGKKYHTIKKGDTYWQLGIDYGTPWKQIYEWNKYPIYTLPIGKIMRVR